MSKTLKLQAKVTGKGIPLLLVPGGLTGWNSWEPFVDSFVEMQRKVIRVQLLNVEYGFDGRQLPADYSVKTESMALDATLKALGHYTPIDIVAWSFGAFVSLDYALDHPENIHTLTLIEPPAIWILRNDGELDAQTQKSISFLGSLQGNITDDMLAAFLSEIGLAGQGQSVRDLPQWRQWLPYKQSLRCNPVIITHNDELKRLQAIKSPVLLIKGTGSALFLHKIIKGLGSNLPDSETVEFPEGHAPHIVSRDRFLQEWEKFQNNHSAAAA